MEKTKNQSQYVHKLLVLCKTWNGPAISIEELESILSQHPDSAEKIIKTELTYYKRIHRSENIAAPSLLKLNKISHEERLSNLCIASNGQSTSFTTLSKNKDVLQVLLNNNQNQTNVKKKYLMCQIPIKMLKKHATPNSSLHNLKIYSSKGCIKTSHR